MPVGGRGVNKLSVVIVTLGLHPQPARAEALPNLSGRWAQVQVTTSVVEVPFKGPSEAKVVSLALLDMEQEEEELQIVETVCGIESDGPTRVIRTEYPPRFAQALSGRARRARLRWQGGRLRYIEPRSYRSSGVRLEDPEQDALPDGPSDPRVLDEDGDGHPGLTVRVAGWVNGEVYLVQRGWSELEGVVRGSGQIEGQVAWNSEQRVLEASSAMLESTPASRPHPASNKHFFRMARVPSKATCAELLTKATGLFGI